MIGNRTAADSSFRYASFGMTASVWVIREEGAAAAAPPLLLPSSYKRAACHSDRREESQPLYLRHRHSDRREESHSKQTKTPNKKISLTTAASAHSPSFGGGRGEVA
jgi:hypothetical protein